MPLKIPPPAKVDYEAVCPVGRVFPKHSVDYFKVEKQIERWGVVRSMRVTVLRNEKQTHDIWMQDFGVKLYKGEIWLSMQFYDPCGKPAKKNNYRVVADILFLGQTVDSIELNVDWPKNKTAD